MRARALNVLSARKVDTLKEPGRYADGGGLYLVVTKTRTKSWLFMYHFGGKRREKGLGSLASVGLADAREKAAGFRSLVEAGKDPLETREAATGGRTFGEAAIALVSGVEAGWKNPKHRQQWRNTLSTYCAPVWSRDVASITTEDVLTILRPIWLEKGETAARLRGRIERVLDSAKATGHRSGENPARWRGHLDLMLPKRKKGGSGNHHPAMPYADVPEFVRGLKTRHSMAARALEFLILNWSRTGEVLGATWAEVGCDPEAAVWTIPGARMKKEIEHTVPLTEAARVVLRAMAVFGIRADAPIFPGTKGKQLSNMAMDMLLRRMGCDDVTVHGFRSSARDWAGEETDFPRELAEMALAHQVGSEVERAYRRGTALEKRRELMEAWAKFVMGVDTRQIAEAE